MPGTRRRQPGTPLLSSLPSPRPQHREHYIDGRRVDAKAAVPRDQGGGKLTRKMFVGGIGEVSDAEFRNHFAAFGSITVGRGARPGVQGLGSCRRSGCPPQASCEACGPSVPSALPAPCCLLVPNRLPPPSCTVLRPQDCVVLRKPDGSSRGFGFVTYDDEMSVEKASAPLQHPPGCGPPAGQGPGSRSATRHSRFCSSPCSSSACHSSGPRLLQPCHAACPDRLGLPSAPAPACSAWSRSTTCRDGEWT